MDLADFPRLKNLDLLFTAVTGDIRDIGENDFAALKNLELPYGVYGGRGHQFQSISEATELMRTLYLLKKQHPALKMEGWHGMLSRDSPDWYESAVDDDGFSRSHRPPFYIRFVEAGSRIGYQWQSCDNGYAGRYNKRGDSCCKVSWLDPEPDRESSDYDEYIEELHEINRHVNFYGGFHQPPTEEEYNRLIEEYDDET